MGNSARVRYIVIIATVTLRMFVVSVKTGEDDQEKQSSQTTSSMYSFKNPAVKDVLRGGATLLSGGSLLKDDVDEMIISLLSWLIMVYSHSMPAAVMDPGGNMNIEKFSQDILSKFEVDPEDSVIWKEVVGRTALVLFDKDDDGLIFKEDFINVDKVRIQNLLNIMRSLDVERDGLTLDDIEMTLFMTSTTQIENIKKKYRGTKITREEITEEIISLIEKFIALEKQNQKSGLPTQGWSVRSVLAATSARIILTAVIASIIVLVVWDTRRRSALGQARVADREVLRQRREQYIQSVTNQIPPYTPPATKSKNPEQNHLLSGESTLKISDANKNQITSEEDVSENIKGSSPGCGHIDDMRSTSQTKSEANRLEAELQKDCFKMPSQNSETVKSSLHTQKRINKNIGQSNLELDNQTSVRKKLKPKTQEERKPVSIEDQLLEVLSDVLDAQVKLRTGSPEDTNPLRVLYIQNSDLYSVVLAAATDDKDKIQTAVETSAISRLFEKQVTRVYGKTVPFGCKCWSRCYDRLRTEKDAVISLVLKHMKKRAKDLIVTCLNEVTAVEEDSYNDEGLWSSFHPDPTKSTEGRLLLECISNWDVDTMRPELLDEVLQHTETLPHGHRTWVKVMRSAGMIIRADSRCDEHFLKYGKMLAGLETLFKMPSAKFILHKQMQEEIEGAKTSLGSYFERDSVFGPLLALTTVPVCVKDGADLRNPNAAMWTSLKGFPMVLENDVQPLRRNISKGRELVRQVVVVALKEAFRIDSQVAVQWLSRILALNELRTTVILRVHPTDGQNDLAVSDGFMINLCHVLLDLCLPFCGIMQKIAKIDASYVPSPNCLLEYNQEPSLAGGLIVSQSEVEMASSSSPECPTKMYNFMTQIFHVTLRAINVGFMPALQQFKKQMKVMNDSMAHAEEMGMGEQAKGQRLSLLLQWEAHLMDYNLLESGTRFYLTVCQWITHLLNKAREGQCGEKACRRQEQLALQQVPEFVIKDMAHWFTFITSHGTAVHRNILDSVQLGDFIETCVLFLTRRDLLPGPIPASALCQTLLTFVSGSKPPSQSGWARSTMSNLELAVHSCAAMQKNLCPGLVRIYISVDVVEGLDVDKDDFDKFASRAEIGRLLTKLWNREDCRLSIFKMCGTKQFQLFLGAIFDTLLYQLHDSLARLANVRKLELAKPTWDSLPPKEQAEKSQFLKSEEHVAKGFMSMATETITLLETITSSDTVARCLTVMPLAKRAASAFLGFFESLCGSRSVDFKVKDMKKYNWEPRLLLMQLTGIVLKIVKQEEEAEGNEENFTMSMATDADFNPQTMVHALQVLEEKTIAKDDTVAQFKTLTEMLYDVHAVYSKKDEGADQALLEEQLHMIVDQEQLEKDYQTTLGPLSYDTASILETHAFQSNACAMPVDARSKRCRALMMETRIWMKDLPIHASAAIFLRQDEDRMDVVRALVTGPQDTPYSLGCFVFDVYFPPTYPDIPPLVKFITTGGGTVRFNPNLYADGKVCLSLLGTWHGGDSSQKWQPAKSSLYQVLLSIQSMILISTPMYNEPGYEGIQGSAEGDAQSDKYNAKLRLSTLRHAVLSQITHPPRGFEKVVKRHFSHLKDALKKQCYDWHEDTNDTEMKRKMKCVIEDLRVELDRLDLHDEEENAETDSNFE